MGKLLFNEEIHHRAGVPKPGVGTPCGVGMLIMWGHKEVMGSVGSLIEVPPSLGLELRNIQAGITNNKSNNK